MMRAMDYAVYEQFLAELADLDEQTIIVEGKELRPSQCYHLGVDPAHILFNTNCPASLKTRLNALLVKYRFLDHMPETDQEA
jgi:hypothetical protein